MNLKQSQKLITAVLLILIVFTTACTNTTKKTSSRNDLIVKKWKYDTMEIGGQVLTSDQIPGTATMEFLKDGSFKMEFGGMNETGTWKIEGDSLKTVSTIGDKEQKQSLYIEELTEGKLTVTGIESGATVKLTMVPVTGS